MKIVLLTQTDVWAPCRQPAHILDIYEHPLLDRKWKDVLKGVAFLSPAADIVTEGRRGPLHTSKPLAMLALSDDADAFNESGNVRESAASICEWGNTLGVYEGCAVLRVDVDETHQWMIHRLLKSLNIPICRHIDLPNGLPGHAPRDKRATIHCHFALREDQHIQKEMVATFISKQIALTHEP